MAFWDIGTPGQPPAASITAESFKLESDGKVALFFEGNAAAGALIAAMVGLLPGFVIRKRDAEIPPAVNFLP